MTVCAVRVSCYISLYKYREMRTCASNMHEHGVLHVCLIRIRPLSSLFGLPSFGVSVEQLLDVIICFVVVRLESRVRDFRVSQMVCSRKLVRC
jgi:hypothetical protein